MAELCRRPMKLNEIPFIVCKISSPLVKPKSNHFPIPYFLGCKDLFLVKLKSNDFLIRYSLAYKDLFHDELPKNKLHPDGSCCEIRT